MLILDDFNQLTKHKLDVRSRVSTQFHADFADCPCCIVTHRDVVWIQVVSKNGQEIGDEWVNMLETRFG